jgi:protein ImuA
MSETYDFTHDDPRRGLVNELRRQVGAWEASLDRDETAFSSGIAALDRLLPGGALGYGMLTEWLSGLARSGAATLSLLCAREACRPGGVLVVIDRRQTFYPPAAAAWGIDLDRLLIVRPQSARDELWAAVQALRSPAVAAMWAEIDRLDSRAFRRLQLAAQAGRTLGLLLRPAKARGQPTWADVRLAVEGKMQNANCKLKNATGQTSAIENLHFALCNLQSAAARRIQLRVLHSHGKPCATYATLEIDDATRIVREAPTGFQHDAHPLPLAAELANPTPHPHSARA